jgi:hypothetical protein
VVWRTFRDIETSEPGAFPYPEIVGDEDVFG